MADILIIEDNPETQILLESILDRHSLHWANSVNQAKEMLTKHKYNLALLDLNLPDGDGMKLLADWTTHKKSADIPFMIISGKTDISTKVMAFSIGAEDFITKPIDPAELKARVTAKLKRLSQQQDAGEVLRIGDLQIDIPKQRLTLHSQHGSEVTIELTSIEFRLLLNFAKHPERVFSRNQLLDLVWGQQIAVTERTVDTHIGHLRKKIVLSHVRIDTVIGEGYRILVSRT